MNEQKSNLFQKINIIDEYKSCFDISENFSNAKQTIIPNSNDKSFNDIFTFSQPSYNFRTIKKIHAVF